MGYSSVKQSNGKPATYYGHQSSKWIHFGNYSTGSEAKKIKKVVIPMASGNGSFTAGDNVTGNGSTLTKKLQINGQPFGRSVSVTATLRPTNGSSGSYPNTSKLTKYTFTGEITIPANSTVKFEINNVNSGKVLCISPDDVKVTANNLTQTKPNSSGSGSAQSNSGGVKVRVYDGKNWNYTGVVKKKTKAGWSTDVKVKVYRGDDKWEDIKQS